MPQGFTKTQRQRLKAPWHHLETTVMTLPLSETTRLLLFYCEDVLASLNNPEVMPSYLDVMTELVKQTVEQSPLALKLRRDVSRLTRVLVEETSSC